MSLNAGAADCSSGMAKTIYDYLTGDSRNGFSGSMTAAQSDAVKALCYAIARGVVYELQVNAVVGVTADTDAFGAGIPAAPVVVQGAIT